MFVKNILSLGIEKSVVRKACGDKNTTSLYLFRGEVGVVIEAPEVLFS